MEIILIIAGIILTLLFFSKEEEQTHTYNAHFGDEDEFLSSNNSGFAVVGDRAISAKLSCEHCFLSGPSGAGKSSIVIYPSLASISKGKHSIVINDVSGELWSSSQYLTKRGYKVLRFDPSQAAYSESFNPLVLCSSVADINKLAQIIVQNGMGKSSSDPFWELASTNLIALMCRYLRFHAAEEICTLQNALRLVEKFAVNGKAVDALFVKANDDSLLDAYKAVLVSGEKTLQSIIATARTALQLWSDPEVCKATARNSIDFEELRHTPIALFISTPLKDLRYYLPLTSLFIQSLFNFLLSRIPKKEEKNVYLLLDEFGSMRFPDIITTICNVRKNQAGILICVQDEMALTATYGKEQAHQIKTNCSTKVFLANQPLHTAKDLSVMFGRFSLVDHETGKEKGSRELMTADEVRMCDDALILIKNNPPLRCQPVPYYKNFWLRSLTNSRPIELTPKEILPPPLLQFGK
jgi:type IV secretion system protein VirD4